MAKKETGAKPAPKKAKKFVIEVEEEKPKPKPLAEATPDEKLLEISTEIKRVEKTASKMVVTTREEYAKASEFLVGTIQARLKRAKEIQAFFTDPYVEARRVALKKMKEIEDKFGVTINPLEAIERAIKRSMSDFLLEEDKKAQAEEAKLRKQQEAKEKKAEAKGEEFIPAPLPSVARPQATVRSDVGKSTAVKEWKFEVTAEAKVPREFCKVDETLIRQAVKDGARNIEGVRIYEDFKISGKAY